MCGRVFQIYTEDQFRDRYLPEDADTEISLEPVFNLCPTMDSPVVQLVDGHHHIARMRWQFVPGAEPVFSTKLSTIKDCNKS